MRAVAACFGAITSGFFAAISSDPNVKSFLVSNTVKSSMDSFVRSRIELESELQFRDLNVKDGWSNNKKTAQTYASMIVGWSVEDDDLADAICHREFIINLREALEDIKEEVEFALENQTDTIIKEYYLGIKNKMESKYGLNLDSVLRYAKKMTQDDFGTLEGSHVLSND